jgi:hypothetical protein
MLYETIWSQKEDFSNAGRSHSFTEDHDKILIANGKENNARLIFTLKPMSK